MLGKLIPLIIALIGLGAGVGAGVALRPEPVDMSNACGDMEHMAKYTEEAEEEPANSDFVRLNNQFVVPVVKDSQVASLVVMSLTLEVVLGEKEAVFQREPKLRDALLQEMFDHANVGGFDGAFTSAPQMNSLRTALLERARSVVGNVVKDVLVIDVVRQDAAGQ